MHGLLLVDKPIGPTSMDVVRAVRKALDTRRVGHTGTLDPHASGLLPVPVGASTKLPKFLTLEPKVYAFEVVLGVATDSADAEGERVASGPTVVGRDELEAALGDFLGEVSQVPPKFSAIKVAGKRAYKMARKGEEFELEPRTVRIEALELDALEGNVARLRVQCGSGTYVRSLAVDLAAAVGTVAHARNIRRLRVGQWSIEDAVGLDRLRTTSDARQLLMSSLRMMRGLPTYELSDAELERVLHGNRIRADVAEEPGHFIRLVGAGRLVAVAQVLLAHDGHPALQPRRVLHE